MSLVSPEAPRRALSRRCILAAATAAPCLLAVSRTWAQTVQMPAPEDRDYPLIVEAAQAAATMDVGKPVKLTVSNLQTAGNWAFIRSQMKSPSGTQFDYGGTRYAEAAANGGKSYSHVALLRRRDQGWQIVVQAVGPTDVAWAPWAATYGAPPALFNLP
ncbi:hypothetical protein [Reyranella sp. CPCC 100927]|uniref:hypothetical protein n=1 Tax=Reyranella sp. CPCC 100927 TaxID=2599616 RepID=UPI0011B6FC4A|nr:hypothetical protein [Reyranella sp. CPCC 100927]TWS98496.1 hypothetical protein FQU96_35890 [Reyranella sp. CPCC 100927]